MFEAGITSTSFGLTHPFLFKVASLSYVILTIVSLTLLFDRYSFKSTPKISLLLITDLLALLILIQASGGLAGGLGYLLVITAAIASMFLKGLLAFGYAALISIALISQALVLDSKGGTIKALFGAGTLGVLVFVTTASFQYLSNKIKSSTEEAAEKSAYARQLVKLAQLIVTRMQTGITVINEENTIELINDSALQYLELNREKSYLGQDITTLCDIQELLSLWHHNPINGMARVHRLNNKKDVRINFASVETDRRPLTILYIEDYRTLMQQAQQLKLASLGRLTANIAHEIRNPLGAISHAAQLLSESEYIDPSDQRFTEIILQHSNRVNEIIENTMTLSKRKEPKAESIDLKQWIPHFIEEFSTAKECDIHYQWDEEQEDIKVDPTHLRQILTNLFDNGLRYSMEHTGKAKIQVNSGISKHDETTFIEVIDFGLGVPPDEVSSIFEPFFTTGKQGTGLGLYISRELCEINQARLNYQRTADNKSRFKINFPHHQRMI
ncbi:MAG: two-component sensor histidine kinase [Agarilytica sp.]